MYHFERRLHHKKNSIQVEVITKLYAINSLGACPRKRFELKVSWITNSQKLLQNYHLRVTNLTKIRKMTSRTDALVKYAYVIMDGRTD